MILFVFNATPEFGFHNETLEQARKTLSSAEKTLSSDAPVQSDLRDTLAEVTKAARTLQDLADYLSRHPESLLRGKKGD